MSTYGKALAGAVAARLRETGSISNLLHRDYCGVGFAYHMGTYIYTHFNDGTPDLIINEGKGPWGIIRTFASEHDFVNWLSVQTDASLSGSESNDPWYTNNQRITFAMLKQTLGIV